MMMRRMNGENYKVADFLEAKEEEAVRLERKCPAGGLHRSQTLYQKAQKY
jgi:hypothetical protein